MVPVILHTANAVTVRAFRPPNRMAPSLRSDDRPLNARQQPLRFGQGQTQTGDIAEVTGAADLQDVRARPLAFSLDFHQPQHPSHASTLGQRTDAKIPDRRRTPNLAMVPAFGEGPGSALVHIDRPHRTHPTCPTPPVLAHGSVIRQRNHACRVDGQPEVLPGCECFFRTGKDPYLRDIPRPKLVFPVIAEEAAAGDAAGNRDGSTLGSSGDK